MFPSSAACRSASAGVSDWVPTAPVPRVCCCSFAGPSSSWFPAWHCASTWHLDLPPATNHRRSATLQLRDIPRIVSKVCSCQLLVSTPPLAQGRQGFTPRHWRPTQATLMTTGHPTLGINSQQQQNSRTDLAAQRLPLLLTLIQPNKVNANTPQSTCAWRPSLVGSQFPVYGQTSGRPQPAKLSSDSQPRQPDPGS